MSDTMRINPRVKRCIEAFRSTMDERTRYFNTWSDADIVNAICYEWVRQNFTAREANEILESEELNKKTNEK